jgi:multiple sugar transport system substrate-binding protein
VIGTEGEIEQYRTMAETYAPPGRHVRVIVEGWPNDAAMLDAFRNGTRVPDVFMITRLRLGYLLQHQLIQPLDGLLDDRGFDYGDVYPRSSLTAFGSNNRLECLPYGVQPDVIFYNKGLVKLDRLKSPVTPGQGWSMAQFANAARWAVNHHSGIAGLHIDDDLSGIAPFVYSGGGSLYDDETSPSSLALSSTANATTLTQVVRTLNSPGVRLTPDQLLQHTPQEWFERGKLAVLEGSRRLVPELRAWKHLNFDVMPMPTLSTSATVGSLTGLCVSSHPRDLAKAAGFLVYASSPGALSLVSYGGYLQPANQNVALSDAFQQPGQLPRHASVFTFSVKSMVYPTIVARADDLDRVVQPMLDELLDGNPSDVQRVTRRIDRASYRILGPTYGPSASPSS